MINQDFLTRRGFLKAAAVGLGGVTLATIIRPKLAIAAGDPASIFNIIQDPDNPANELEAQHTMEVRLPLIAEDGANVPIIIAMEHPMEPDHYIKSLQIIGFNDPIVSKGIFHLSPANGQAYWSTQMRMDGGDTGLFVIAECSQHGKWVTSHDFKVSLGGC